MSQPKRIKGMKLYCHPERIYRELAAAGYADGSALDEKILSRFDQYHYFGTDALDEAILALKIDSDTNVLEIGSGIGGCARYLAGKTGCRVTAVEIQPDYHAVATTLTERCGLSVTVSHRCEDILGFNSDGRHFDVVVSWLCFLHIPDRLRLLDKCRDLLADNGQLYVEDFYKRGDYSAQEAQVLSEDVFCPYLPTWREYDLQLVQSGFEEIEAVDKTDSWREFVRQRARQYIENHDSHVKMHGAELVEGLEDFYKKMSWLFAGGHLGGIRIMGRKSACASIVATT